MVLFIAMLLLCDDKILIMIYFALIIPGVCVQLLISILVTRDIRLFFRLLLFLAGFVLLLNNSFYALAYDMRYLVIHQKFQLHFWEQALSLGSFFWFFIALTVVTSGLIIYGILARIPNKWQVLFRILHLLIGGAFASSLFYDYLMMIRASGEDVMEKESVTMIYSAFTLLMICSVAYLVLQTFVLTHGYLTGERKTKNAVGK